MDERLVRELSAYTPTIRRPNGFGITVAEFAEYHHCSIIQARTMLEKAVKDGILEKHIMLCGNTRTAVFCRPGDWPPKNRLAGETLTKS